MAGRLTTTKTQILLYLLWHIVICLDLPLHLLYYLSAYRHRLCSTSRQHQQHLRSRCPSDGCHHVTYHTPCVMTALIARLSMMDHSDCIILSPTIAEHCESVNNNHLQKSHANTEMYGVQLAHSLLLEVNMNICSHGQFGISSQ